MMSLKDTFVVVAAILATAAMSLGDLRISMLDLDHCLVQGKSSCQIISVKERRVLASIPSKDSCVVPGRPIFATATREGPLARITVWDGSQPAKPVKMAEGSLALLVEHFHGVYHDAGPRLLVAGYVPPGNADVPSWAAWYLTPSEGKLESAPVAELSGVVSFTRPGHIHTSPDGSLAAFVVAKRENLNKAQAQIDDKEKGYWDSYVYVVAGGQTRAIAAGNAQVIGFSDRSDRLLLDVPLRGCEYLDVRTGVRTTCSFLPAGYVLCANGRLTAALAIVDPEPELSAEDRKLLAEMSTMMGIADDPRERLRPTVQSRSLVLFGEGQPAVVLMPVAENAELVAHAIGDEWLVTDGANLWQITRGQIAKVLALE